jgi:UDP-glucuronate 4-epimerase
MLEAITGVKAIIDEKGKQPGDVPLTWADITKANQVLGYAPIVQLEDGLRDFVAWYRSSMSSSN